MSGWWPRVLALMNVVGGLALADEVTIKIAAVGDIMLGTDYPDDRLPENDGADFLRVVGPVLRAADITLGNLEGVIMGGGTPDKICSSPLACFLFRSPPHYVGYLREAGFDAMSLATNHARDFGEHGRSATMLTLDTYRIHHSGRRAVLVPPRPHRGPRPRARPEVRHRPGRDKARRLPPRRLAAARRDTQVPRPRRSPSRP